MKELRIALLPNEAPDKELSKHATMTQHLEKVLGKKVKVQVGIDLRPSSKPCATTMSMSPISAVFLCAGRYSDERERGTPWSSASD